jgi:general secretion pathway protein G
MQMNQAENGRFRLVKLMTVITAIVAAIIVVLAVATVPGYNAAIKSSRESVLREDLHVLREGIHSYTADRKKPPQSLRDLLAAGYLKQIPEDPMTHSKETWVVEPTADVHSLKIQAGSGGVDDVHSGSQEQGSNARPYSSW